jgi:FtsZ-binding cell division protein ZapB
MDIKEIKIKSKITTLKMKLQQTDYQAIKYAEGLISEEEYAPIKAQRQAWRDEINALQEKMINN